MEQFFNLFRIAMQGIGKRTVILLWLLFPVITISNAQNYSTWGEIYNFEVGDEFHYWYEFDASAYQWYSEYYSNDFIINKSMSTDSLSVTYTIISERITKTFENPVWTFTCDTFLVTYDSLNSFCIADTVYVSTVHNNRIASYKHFFQINPPQYQESTLYVEGCGLVEYGKGTASPYTTTIKELLYYKKGEEEWGTPYILVGTEEFKGIEWLVKCFPNPFTTSTTLEYELTEPSRVQLTIYNAIGEVVYKSEDRHMSVGKHSFTWNPERHPEGMYYVVLRSEEGVSVVKMVKQ